MKKFIYILVAIISIFTFNTLIAAEIVDDTPESDVSELQNPTQALRAENLAATSQLANTEEIEKTTSELTDAATVEADAKAAYDAAVTQLADAQATQSGINLTELSNAVQTAQNDLNAAIQAGVTDIGDLEAALTSAQTSLASAQAAYNAAQDVIDKIDITALSQTLKTAGAEVARLTGKLDALTVTSAEIAYMRTELKMGWGQIAHTLGLHPSNLGMGKHKKAENAARVRDMTAFKSSQAFAGDKNNKGVGLSGKADKSNADGGNSKSNAGGNSKGNSGGKGNSKK